MGSGASKLSPTTEIVVFSPADIPTANVEERIKALEIKNRSLEETLYQSRIRQGCAESMLDQKDIIIKNLCMLLNIQKPPCVSFQAQQHGLLMDGTFAQCSSPPRSQLSAIRTLTSSQNDFAKTLLCSNSAVNTRFSN